MTGGTPEQGVMSEPKLLIPKASGQERYRLRSLAEPGSVTLGYSPNQCQIAATHHESGSMGARRHPYACPEDAIKGARMRLKGEAQD